MSKLWNNLRRFRRMGCEQSSNIPDDHPMIFKGKALNEKNKPVEWVTLEVKDVHIIVKGRNRKIIAKWPISGLHRYGYTNNIFLLETGTTCNGGKDMFLFKIERAEALFGVLKDYYNDAEIRRRQLLSHNPALMTRIPMDPSMNLNFNNGNQPTSSNQYVDSNIDPSYVNDEIIASNRPALFQTRGAAGADLDYEIAEPVFALLPAPATRDEMMARRHQSEMVAIYNSDRQSVSLAHHHHAAAMTCRRDSEIHYENVRYDPTMQAVDFSNLPSSSGSADIDIDGQSSRHRLSRGRSLKSDTGGPLLTPASNNTSGVGSMTSGSTSLPVRHKQQQDPWRHRIGALRTSPGILHPPHSARDYVNTSTALSDASGTPLPATATNSFHFNFDFVNRSAPLSRNNSSKLNYVPVDPGSSKLVDSGMSSNCGGASSSTSSGIPGTPRSASNKTTTPHKLERSHSIEYVIIDHNKTRALSQTQKKRQKESRHGSTGTTTMMAAAES